MGSKKAKQVNPSFTPEGWGTGGSDIYVCPMKIKGFHLFMALKKVQIIAK